jgi:hypothetical protein
VSVCQIFFLSLSVSYFSISIISLSNYLTFYLSVCLSYLPVTEACCLSCLLSLSVEVKTFARQAELRPGQASFSENRIKSYIYNYKIKK